MITINPYLNFNGNTEEAFNFYKSVFGGEFLGGISRFKDTPDGDKLPAADQQKVMHIALPIGKGNVLMATDFLESMGHKLIEGNNFSISIETESEPEADKIFAALSAGGNVEMPLQKMFWGDYFGILKDKFGIQWMVNHAQQKN
ncbi:MAG: VOC family protein [Bacteroidia bacterium]|nr:VOC family protein [Bacteroidia bacterium]